MLIEEESLKKRIKKVQKKDKRVVKAVEELKRLGAKMLKKKEWLIKEELVLKKDWIYMLEEGNLRVEIIWLHHDTLVGGHEGRWKMVELVERNYWWPGMIKEIGRYIDRCNAYQRNKNHVEAPAGKLIPNTIPQKP